MDADLVYGASLQAAPAENRDDFALNVLHADGTEVPAVRRVQTVIAQNENGIFRHFVRVLHALFCVSRIDNFSALRGAIDEQRAAVVHRNYVGFPGDDAAHILFAVHLVDDDVVFGVVFLQPVGNHQIAVLQRREHVRAAVLGDQEYLAQQEPAAEDDQKHPDDQTDIPLIDQEVLSASLDDLRWGQLRA